MDSLTVGVVGLGVIGREHIRSFRAVGGVEVAGGYDADPLVEREVCREFGIRAYDTIEELLGDPRVSAISVCTPEGSHVAPVSLAIDAGKHVLIEKPLAASQEDGLVLIRAANSTEKVVMVGQTLRFDPPFAAAKKLLDDGIVGRVTHLSMRRSNSITNGIRAGGRTTVSLFLGVHDLDFCMWALGSRVWRVCTVGVDGVLKRQYALDATDTILGTIELGSGVVGGVEFSWCLPMEGVDVLDAHLEVLGEDGQLVLHRQQGLLEVALRKQQRRVEVNVPDVSGYGQKQSALDIEIAAFVDAVRTGTEAPVGVHEGYEAMVAALAMDESSMERRPVTPSYETPGAD